MPYGITVGPAVEGVEGVFEPRRPARQGDPFLGEGGPPALEEALLPRVGGSLRACDARGGGFCVRAELPAKAPDAMTGAPPERIRQ